MLTEELIYDIPKYPTKKEVGNIPEDLDGLDRILFGKGKKVRFAAWTPVRGQEVIADLWQGRKKSGEWDDSGEYEGWTIDVEDEIKKEVVNFLKAIGEEGVKVTRYESSPWSSREIWIKLFLPIHDINGKVIAKKPLGNIFAASYKGCNRDMKVCVLGYKNKIIHFLGGYGTAIDLLFLADLYPEKLFEKFEKERERREN